MRRLDWDAYKICVEWCKMERIQTIADLKNRVVPRNEYEKLWYERCEKCSKILRKRIERRIESHRF